jgi:hypothetical protein
MIQISSFNDSGFVMVFLCICRQMLYNILVKLHATVTSQILAGTAVIQIS